MRTINVLIGTNEKEIKDFFNILSAKKQVKFFSSENMNEVIKSINQGENLAVIVQNNLVLISKIIETAKEFGYLIKGDLFLDENQEDDLLSLENGFHKLNIYKNGKLIKGDMKPLIATSNLGKIAIYTQIFKELGLHCCSLRDIKLDIEIEENGKNELENAMIKAKAYHEVTGLPVLCNDSGLVIEKFAPADQPGVFVRRYGGRELTDEETIKIFSEKLAKVGGESDAYFNVGIVLCDKNGEFHSRLFKSYRYMKLPASKVVEKGLPLRSLDYNKEFGKYMSEMTIEEANASEGDCIKLQTEFVKEIFG